MLLVNAMFDGMNLVAKEGPLLNQNAGVSILSENTGAHDELGEFALSVNPFDIQELADSIHAALEMDPAERARRLAGLQAIVTARDPGDWIDEQLDDIAQEGRRRRSAERATSGGAAPARPRTQRGPPTGRWYASATPMADAKTIYDLILLLDLGAEDERRAKIVADTRAAIAAEGELLGDQAWGTRPLAYEIDHREAAEYHLLQFSGPPSLIGGARAHPAHHRRRDPLPRDQAAARHPTRSRRARRRRPRAPAVHRRRAAAAAASGARAAWRLRSPPPRTPRRRARRA